MKKLFSVMLIVLLVAGAAFASSYGNSVRVKSVVGTITIAQANENAAGSLYVLDVATVTGEEAGTNYFLSDADISQADVVSGFTVKQTAAVRCNESITLTVTAGQLTFADATTTYSTDAPVLIDTVVTNGVGYSENVVVSTDVNTPNTLKLTLTYQGTGREVGANTSIAAFNATWTQKAELADHPGEYVADITLSYVIE